MSIIRLGLNCVHNLILQGHGLRDGRLPEVVHLRSGQLGIPLQVANFLRLYIELINATALGMSVVA